MDTAELDDELVAQAIKASLEDIKTNIKAIDESTSKYANYDVASDKQIDKVIVSPESDYFIIVYEETEQQKVPRKEKDIFHNSRRKSFSDRFPHIDFESLKFSSPEELIHAMDESMTKVEHGYLCNECQKYCDTKAHAHDHVEIHFAERGTYRYICIKCSKILRTMSTIRHHKAKCTGTRY